MKSPTRVLNLLLVLCSISLPTAMVLLGYFFFQYQEIENLKASLQSENELQSQLMSAQPLENSVEPHLVDEIGIVLNTGMGQSAFKAHQDDVYKVNSLGLRGEEIKRKKQDVTRILLVGDSMVFGWKLKDEDRLSSILNRYVSERVTNGNRVEFHTVAMPGWNVRSARAFLESHVRLLDPDLIVWWTIENDIEDVAGVIPPGQLAQWASPQDRDQSPFAGLSRLHLKSGSFMPAIAERRRENIELIS